MQCEQCGGEYIRQVPWQRFCNDGCRDAWHLENRRLAKQIGELRRAEKVQNAQRQAKAVFGS